MLPRSISSRFHNQVQVIILQCFRSYVYSSEEWDFTAGLDSDTSFNQSKSSIKTLTQQELKETNESRFITSS